MSGTVLRTEQQCEDLAYGFAFLGTGGGGGSPELATRLLSDAIRADGPMNIVDPHDLPDDAWTCTIAAGGSVGGVAQAGPTAEELAALGLTKPKYEGFDLLTGKGLELLTDCVLEMEEYKRIKIEATVPGELGCFNGVGPLLAASRLGISAVDGDYAGGRALPVISEMIPSVYGVSLLPKVSIDRWGDVWIIKEAASVAMRDQISNMTRAAVPGGGLASSFVLLQAKDVRKMVACGSVSKSLEIGRARREAVEKGEDPVDAILEVCGGWLLFKGEVVEEALEDRGEPRLFGYGTHRLKGVGAYEGQTFDVWYQNENHIAWKNGEPYVTSPDLICLVDLESGKAKTNDLVNVGWRVAVLGLQGHPVHRTPQGLKVLSPRFFGYDFDYVPIEERMKGA
jgi:DUF917 family protein